MTEQEKFSFKALYEKADYSLWKIRIGAVSGSKGLTEVLVEGRNTTSADEADFEKKQDQASNIIVNEFADQSLRVVTDVIGKPKEMMDQLDARYDSNSTASNISKMSEIVSVKYSSIKQDMLKHID